MNSLGAVWALNGYLQCLQRLSKKPSDYSVTHIQKSDDIERTAKNFFGQFEDVIQYSKAEKVSFEDFC